MTDSKINDEHWDDDAWYLDDDDWEDDDYDYWGDGHWSDWGDGDWDDTGTYYEDFDDDDDYGH